MQGPIVIEKDVSRQTTRTGKLEGSAVGLSPERGSAPTCDRVQSQGPKKIDENWIFFAEGQNAFFGSTLCYTSEN